MRTKQEKHVLRDAMLEALKGRFGPLKEWNDRHPQRQAFDTGDLSFQLRLPADEVGRAPSYINVKVSGE